MQTIIIKLDSAKLENPDLDLRYYIPNRIEEISGGAIQDNGYDYLNKEIMGIWLQTEVASTAYLMIERLFKEEKFMKNDLSLSAEIYISEDDVDELENCRKVFPK